jgi:sRNA-binding protein
MKQLSHDEWQNLVGIGFERGSLEQPICMFKMKNRLIYWVSLLVALIITLPGKAQQKSPEETKDHADMVLKKERHRERVRANRAEKRAAKAEKRINTKAQHKQRRKGPKPKEEKPRSKG